MNFSSLSFESDPAKAASNLRKHGVSFDEAITTFFDLNAKNWPDEAHSNPGDERWITLDLQPRYVSCLWFIMKKTDSFTSLAPGPLPRPNEPYMKKPETTAPPTITRGKYANLLKQGSNVVILDPDLLDSFPDSPSVNRALRAFLAINHEVQEAGTRLRTRRRPAASATPEFDPRVGAQPRHASR
jgi:uncharacterized DUF497 family protein